MGPLGALTIVGIEGSLLTAAVIFTATYVVVALGRVPGRRLDRTPISFAEYLEVGVPVTVSILVAGLLLLGPR
jgi:hypothetical protein